ncbi:hypothetical protein D3C84_1099470 [compost metagenome]
MAIAEVKAPTAAKHVSTFLIDQFQARAALQLAEDRRQEQRPVTRVRTQRSQPVTLASDVTRRGKEQARCIAFLDSVVQLC